MDFSLGSEAISSTAEVVGERNGSPRSSRWEPSSRYGLGDLEASEEVCSGDEAGEEGIAATGCSSRGLAAWGADAAVGSAAVGSVSGVCRKNGRDAQTPPAMIERPRRTRFLDTPYAPLFQPASGTHRLPGNSAALRLSTGNRELEHANRNTRGRSVEEGFQGGTPTALRGREGMPQTRPRKAVGVAPLILYRAAAGVGLAAMTGLTTLPPAGPGRLWIQSRSGAAMNTVL